MKIKYSEGFDSKLCHEYKIYKDIIGGPGIPIAHWCGVEGPYNVMVINRFELSLEDLVNRQGPLDLQTVLFFTHQMVSTCQQRFVEPALTNCLAMHVGIPPLTQLHTL